MKIACVKTFYGNKEKFKLKKKRKFYHASGACIPLLHRGFMNYKSLTVILPMHFSRSTPHVANLDKQMPKY